MTRTPLHPADIATATGDHAAIGASAPVSEPTPSPTWGLLAALFALWVGTTIIFISSLR